MKICHVNDRFPNFHIKAGGAEQACYDIIDLLDKAGHQNFLITQKPDNSEYKEKLCQVYFVNRLVEKVGYKLSFISRLFWCDPLVYFQTKKILKEIKPDVVHVQLVENLTKSVIVAAKSLKLPVVFSHYEFGFVCPNFSLVDDEGKLCRRFSSNYCYQCTAKTGGAHANKLAHFWRRKVYNKFDRKIDRHIVLANHWKKILVEYGIDESKIEKVPLPVSNVEYNPNITRERDSILFAAWVKPHKGLWQVIQCMPQVVKAIPNVKFYIIEAGVAKDYKDKILNFIKENKIENNIIFLGRKTNTEVKEWLNIVEIVVVPDQWEIAWPVFLAETMFYARPTVAADIGGIGEMLGSYLGLLAKYDNPQDFAKKLVYLLQNKQEAVKMGQRARDHILKICDHKYLRDLLISNYQKAKK